MRFHRLAACATALAMLPLAAEAQSFATTTFTLLPGSIAGADFPGSYGGDIAGAYPVALGDAAARAAVLGAPDGKFLTLPGQGGTPAGEAFPGAYIEVGFGSNFGPDTILSIFESGANGESAHVFLWSDNGGNVQFEFTRGASDETSFDLSAYAGTLALIGGTSFTKVGIGGLDLNGASKGFDLDAVSISAVSEPESYALMFAGFAVVGWMARRRRAT